MPRHRVVIVGGSFGGLQAALRLRRAPVDVTLIDRRNFHLFQPLLYQVAAGAVSAAEIAQPLRSIFRRQQNVCVVLGEVHTRWAISFLTRGRGARLIVQEQPAASRPAASLDDVLRAA